MNRRVRRWRQMRVWTGLAAILVLVLAEYAVVFRLGCHCAARADRVSPAGEIQGLGDWLASR